MSWLLLGLGIVWLVDALNALAPRKRPLPIFVWSFVASWLVIELVWHHLVIGVLVVAALVAGGALDSPVGVVGLVLAVVSLAILVVIGLTTRRTVVSMRGALEELSPGPAAPRFARSSVVVPFLMGRRRGVHTERNITFARVAGKALKLDVTRPSAPVPGGGALRPALIQVHGGAWMIGDKREQGLPLLRHMAAQGWVGFNINYRLSPAATFPDHLVDVKRGLAWIREHAADFGIDPDFLCITGGSAGGHLTALAALTAEDLSLQPGFEDADTCVAAAVPFYGIYDFTPHGAFGADPDIFRRFLEPYIMKSFVADEPERYFAASPVHRVHPDAPPFLVVHGDKDTLAPVQDARRFVERLRAVSDHPVLYAEMQGAQHAFEIFPSVRAARVIEGVERFLTTLWERRHQPASDAEAALEDAVTEGPDREGIGADLGS
ncbi:MAG TPA: alpha/beta hydrolase [Acidimicrobiales bacterium]|nr:alpha/beta hydrolase [Acidimicrobiales bacterium]